MMIMMVESTHRYAGCAIQGRAIEDGGGADDQAQHDQPVDHKVLQGVPPQSEQLNTFSKYNILPWSEHLLCVSVAHERAQEGGAKGCHCHSDNFSTTQDKAIKCCQG